MRGKVPIGMLGWLACASMAWAQEGAVLPPIESSPAPVAPAAAPQEPGAGTASVPVPGGETSLGTVQEQLARNAAALQQAKEEQGKAADPKEVARLQKQVDLLQKQIEVLQKLVQLLQDQLKKQPPPGVAVEKLQEQTAKLEARSTQAARRDQELAYAVDDLREHIDAEERRGPRRPAPLKELFLDSGTNESPLSIYGVLAFDYRKVNSQPGGFEFGELSPQFLLQLNDRFLLEGEISVGPNGSVDVARGQIDWIVNDWLTVVGGRFESPIGFYNERLNHPWFNKFPDNPLFFRQVSPADLNLIGLQLRGAHYLGCSPMKLEYNAWVSNGLETNKKKLTLTDLADLGGLENTYNIVSDDPAFGGRLGIWVPELGLTAGLSGFHNGKYLPDGNENINLYEVDFGFHKGDWDVRFEYAQMFQDAEPFLTQNIRRRGFYAQVAYRPYEATCPYLQKTEVAFRYSQERFKGIDPNKLDLTAFSNPIDVPVDRNQYTVGINYYIYASMVLHFAYEVNHELGKSLNDNQFTAHFAWHF